MSQLFQSMLVGLIALQGLACAGGAGVDAEDTAQGAEAARDTELSAEDTGPEDVFDEELDAPESVTLLSPSERDEQLSALTGPAVRATQVPEVAPPNDLAAPSQLWDGKSRQ